MAATNAAMAALVQSLRAAPDAEAISRIVEANIKMGLGPSEASEAVLQLNPATDRIPMLVLSSYVQAGQGRGPIDSSCACSIVRQDPARPSAEQWQWYKALISEATPFARTAPSYCTRAGAYLNIVVAHARSLARLRGMPLFCQACGGP